MSPCPPLRVRVIHTGKSVYAMTPEQGTRRGRSRKLVLGVLVLAAVGVLLRMRRRSRAT